MPRISRRILAIEESATLAVDAKAKALKAAGEDVIGFGAGEPDFPTPEHIVAAAVEAAGKPTNHRYTPAAGLPALRQAVAAAAERESHFSVKPAQVLITNGAKHAVYNSFAALLDPGDEVIVPSPYWVTYPEVIRLAGGVPVPVDTDETTGFRATVAQLEEARSSRTKAIIFVSPSNPTGAVYPREEMEAVGRWAAENDVWVVSDEIYQHLVYGGAEAHSMPAVVPELADRCIVINGVSKTYAMTGWRVGWMIGPPDVIAAAANMQSHATSNVGNVSQAAALAALEGGLDCVVAMREAFDRRRQTMYQLLSKIPGVECIEPEGAFYAFPSFSGVLGNEFRGFRPATTLELAGVLLDEVKVAIVPGEAFGAPGYARLSYALGDEALAEGVARITEFLGG